MKNTEVLWLVNNSSKEMVNEKCVFRCCDDDKRYPDNIIIHSNVASRKLIFHKILVTEERRKASIHAVSKGKEAFDPPKNFKVCSDHFIDGKSTQSNPDPTLFLPNKKDHYLNQENQM